MCWNCNLVAVLQSRFRWSVGMKKHHRATSYLLRFQNCPRQLSAPALLPKLVFPPPTPPTGLVYSLVVKACIAPGRNKTKEGAAQQHFFWAQSFPRNGINISKWFHNNASKVILKSILMQDRKSKVCNMIMKSYLLCSPTFDRLLCQRLFIPYHNG